MGNHPTPPEQGSAAESDTRDELRTIGFRLREIQRLLGARVEQENRRLEAEGIDPVTDHGFFKATEHDGTQDQ